MISKRRPCLMLLLGMLVSGCSKPGPPATTAPESAPAQNAQEISPPPNSATKIEFIRQAIQSPDRLSEVVPLLRDPDPEVRQAAILAIGPDPTGTIGSETLFPALHDPDAEIRRLTVSALKSRGLGDEPIEMARKLTSPNVLQRLRLLDDLAMTTTEQIHPGPWLERLAHDPEPAVRVGAARVASIRQLQYTKWLDEMAATDADPTVRQLAAWYQSQKPSVRPAGYREGP